MVVLFVIVMIIFSVQKCSAGEVGVRYNNTMTSDVLGFSGGKIVEAKYDHSLCKNIYIEGAVGPYFVSDFDKFTSFVTEVSPGLQVQSGPVRARLSQGVAYMPGMTIPAIEFGTHLSLSLVDDSTDTYLGIERTHYSSGSSSDPTNTGLDMTGLIMGFKL